MTEDGTQSSATVLASNVFLDLNEDGREEILQYCFFRISSHERMYYWSTFLAALFNSPLLVAEMSVFPKMST